MQIGNTVLVGTHGVTRSIHRKKATSDTLINLGDEGGGESTIDDGDDGIEENDGSSMNLSSPVKRE
jgi:hypothetical protein